MFKKGDKVICININNSDNRLVLGREYEVAKDSRGMHTEILVGNREEDWYTSRFKLLVEYKNKQIMSTLKQKFNNLFVQEPQKSFRKAGITDDSDMLTEEGQTVFLTWLLKNNQAEFKKEVVDPILAEEKEQHA